ncbi:MAG: type I secretion system permease/ATPase [Alphaproteobacteria bacterium]|nr:type I secretion system permease/ATPase [Alphaproteobacteria bacterium]
MNNPAADQPEPQLKAHEQPTDSWPLEADRLAVHSSLVECVRLLAGHFGRRTSTNALTAGLPIPKSGITPSLLMRAAERADLTAKMAHKGLEALAIAPNFPCILVLERKQGCILWDVEYPDNQRPEKVPGKPVKLHAETKFLVTFPETEGEKRWLTLGELKAMYAEYVFFVRPVARSDDRAGPATIDNARDWFWGTLKENWSIYREVIVASVMVNFFALGGTLFAMNVYDRVVPNLAFETLWVLAAGVTIVYLFDFILKNLRATFLDAAGKRADVKISAKLFEQILGMNLAARPASAGVLASNMREFETIRDFFTSATMAALIDLPFAFLFIIIIGVIGGPLAFVVLLAVPLVILGGWALQKPMEKVIKESLHENALKNALLFETITGLETIKTMAAEGNMQRQWEELNEKAAKTGAKVRRISTFAINYSGLIQQVNSVVMMIAGVYMIANAWLTMGGLIGCVILSGRALAPLSQIAAIMMRFNQSVQALKQLEELMRKPVERPAGKHFISLNRVQGRIEFRDVVFKYPGQTVPAVDHVTISVEPGEHIGIIGAVGSGKTTLERLILNLYQPDSGSIMLDGSDVRQIDPGDLRRNIGSVQQNAQLFYGSVRENITMGHETAPDRAVLRAAELAGVMEFLKDSQTGLDTQVGERGEALSGGQRQAVAIARALLYDPPILILDEPTASMDPASENRLRKRLAELTKDKTTLVITHKGSMLNLVSKIILLDRGRIVAFGPKDEVIQKLQSRQFGTAAEQSDI